MRTDIDSGYRDLTSQIVNEAEKIYQLYAEEDVRHGNIKPEELERYPNLGDRDGIWNLLKPFRLEVFPGREEVDYSISYDVAWWNPHYFIAEVLAGELVVLQVDG